MCSPQKLGHSTHVMSTIVEESLFNSSTVFMHTILSGISSIVLYTIGLTSDVGESVSSVSSIPVFSWTELFSFDELQLALLQLFLLFLFFNIVLILIAWKIYGKKIYDSFMRPVTPKVIEDLKKSVSRLNLPKEHSPRV